MMANDPSLKSNIEGIDQYVQQMIDAVGQIYVTIIDKNKEWNDCQKYVQVREIFRKISHTNAANV